MLLLLFVCVLSCLAVFGAYFLICHAMFDCFLPKNILVYGSFSDEECEFVRKALEMHLPNCELEFKANTDTEHCP